MANNKKNKIIVKLLSEGLTKDNKKTKYFYTTTKNKKSKKIKLKKFDPKAYNETIGRNGKHVFFKEKKI